MAGTPGMKQKRRPGGEARQRSWTAMRIYKTFTSVQIEAVAEIAGKNLHKYILDLSSAGYLVIWRPKRNGHPGGHTIWRIARDSGPNAPIVRFNRDGVYDPNRDIVYPFRDDAHD